MDLPTVTFRTSGYIHAYVRCRGDSYRLVLPSIGHIRSGLKAVLEFEISLDCSAFGVVQFTIE
jgi:hypothetical protein